MPMLPAETAGFTMSGAPSRVKMPGEVVAPAGITSQGDVGTPARSNACFMSIFDVVTS